MTATPGTAATIRPTRFVLGVALTAAALAGCSPGGDRFAFVWAPFIVGVAGGLIAAAAIIARGFSRPGSLLRRLGYVALAMTIWVILSFAGLLLAAVMNPVY